MKMKVTYPSRVRGCLLGGAMGDALGAPVEFLGLAEIRGRFGPEGITRFAPAYGRPCAITDDTQMTLFTAEALIRGNNRMADRGLCHAGAVAHRAYLRWLHTQGDPWHDPDIGHEPSGWLVEKKELHARRAPGNTCLSALRAGYPPDEVARNDSKGCGGVMRVAPVGLAHPRSADAFSMAVDFAALTHGHPTGYWTAGVLASIVCRICGGEGILDATRAALDQLEGLDSVEETRAAVTAAVALAEADTVPTAEALEELGAGWIAEEALAMGLYCALVSEDLWSALVLAVNHSGDSDSTGSIAGNLMGALLGDEALPEEALAALEARDIITRVADDLVHHFQWKWPADRSGELPEPDYERYPPW